MKYLFSVIIMIMSMISISAQESEKKVKSNILGQWRSYYLGTTNHGELRDFHALATGGKLGATLSAGSFSVALVGYTSFNLGIQDLATPDPTTNRLSRYELGLFDVNKPSSKGIGILGEANLSFGKRGHRVQVGRFKIKSPLMNLQDGRMIPTLFQGIWYRFESDQKLILQSGLINAVATRSTDRFERLKNTYGLYPMGRNPDGGPSNYRGNIDSDFIWITNLRSGLGQQVDFNLWNYYVDNVFNTTYARATWKIQESSFQVAAEAVMQRKLANGGNEDAAFAYFQSESAYNLGVQLAYAGDNGKLTFAYNHIPDGGRFLFPREWGREGLFTFQKRERTDGSANNHAFLIAYAATFSIKELAVKGIYSLGHQWKADVTNSEDNKYALPSYRHLNLDWFFTHSAIPNFKPELLLTYKQGMGDFPDNPNFILNKVDLLIVNLIVNYNF